MAALFLFARVLWTSDKHDLFINGFHEPGLLFSDRNDSHSDLKDVFNLFFQIRFWL